MREVICNRYGRVKAADLISFHLTVGLDAHPKRKGAHRHAAVIVKRAFHWASNMG